MSLRYSEPIANYTAFKYTLVMIITAAGLLVKDNKLLLGKRQADRAWYPDTWDLIGGKCESVEPPEQALVRELQEEIGITPTKYKYIGKLHDLDRNNADEYEFRMYIVTDWNGTPENRQIHEHSEIGWFTVGDAAILKLARPEYIGLFKNLEMP